MKNLKIKKNITEESFFEEISSRACALSGCDAVSVFHCLADKGLLKGIYKFSGGFFYEIAENIFFEDENALKKSVFSLKPFEDKAGEAWYYYYPVEIKGDFDLSGFSRENTVFFRFEKFTGGKAASSKIKKALAELDAHMENFYLVDFEILKTYYYRNIGSSARLGEIFASSIKTEDSYKTIISGLQKHFGFDRIRFYVVKESEKKLVGAYSVDVTGKVKSLDYDRIILEPGSHRFADIVLEKTQQDYSRIYGDMVFYLPLRMENRPMGLLIFDNLLSQMSISLEEREILKSFASQIAMAIDNINLFNKIEELSLYDELTKLPLRRYFNSRFQEEFYRAERFSQPLSLLWIDIDYFKEINDTYGHQIGDVALREVGRIINSSLRKIDFPCRYGGDEIIIMLPQAGHIEAYNLGRRLASEIRNVRIPVPFSSNREISLTASMGISSYPSDASKQEELLARADEALYWVKSHGRDSIKAYCEIKQEKDEKKEG